MRELFFHILNGAAVRIGGAIKRIGSAPGAKYSIIYPCTRTKKIIGKNLVLFNRYDAVPIKDSIREIIYK